MSASTPSAAPAGWYADPYASGSLRYFDGASWTPHLAPGPGAPMSTGPRAGATPDDPLHWLVPTGRSGQSIAAGYVALFATVLWVLGPVAVWLGVSALRTSGRTGVHGRGRAWFGIVVGALATLLMVATLVSLAT